MAGLRFRLDLFIQEVEDGTIVGGVMIPTALANKIPQIRQAVLTLKSYAKKLNNESSLTAVYHKCYHDESPLLPCEPEKEI